MPESLANWPDWMESVAIEIDAVPVAPVAPRGVAVSLGEVVAEDRGVAVDREAVVAVARGVAVDRGGVAVPIRGVAVARAGAAVPPRDGCGVAVAGRGVVVAGGGVPAPPPAPGAGSADDWPQAWAAAFGFSPLCQSIVTVTAPADAPAMLNPRSTQLPSPMSIAELLPTS